MLHPFKQTGPNLFVWVPETVMIDGKPIKNNQNVIGQVLYDCVVRWPRVDMSSTFKKGEWIVMGATREKGGIMGEKYVGVEVTEVLAIIDEEQVKVEVGGPDYTKLVKKEEDKVE